MRALLVAALSLWPASGSAQIEDYRLHRAAQAGDLAVVRSLLAEGVLADNLDENGRTALFFAAAGNHVAVIDELVAYGVALDAPDRQHITPLMVAAYVGHREAVTRLIELGADGLVTVEDRNAADIAVEQGHDEVASLLAQATSPLARMRRPSVVPNRVYVEREVEERPQRVRGVALEYPQDLLREGMEGGCWVSFVVGADDEVDEATVRTIACTHPAFARSARRAVLETTYRAARIGGVRVPARMEHRVNFGMRDGHD